MKDTIDLKTVFRVLLDKIIWIVLVAILCGGLAYAYSSFVIQPTYTSSVDLYVQGGAASEDAVTSAEVAIRQRIVPLYRRKLLSNDYMDTLSATLKQQGIQASAGTLAQSILVVTDEEASDILRISVVTGSPEASYAICSTLVETAPKAVEGMMQGYTLDSVGSPTNNPKDAEGHKVIISPSSPNVMRNTALGAIIGIILTCGIVIVLHLFDNTIKDSDQVIEMTQLRFMGEIPDMNETFKGGYSYYKYSRSVSGQGGGK